jgi:hypothetical protein
MGSKAVLAVMVILLAPLALRPQTLDPSQTTDSAQVGQLLADAKSLASLLKSDLATIDFFALSAGGSQTYADMLNLYTGRATALRTQALKLESMRKYGSHWQQIAVDRMVPVMKELASSAEAAISSTKVTRNRPSSTDYREYLKLNSDLAGELSAVIAACVDYAKTREDLDHIAEKIGAPSGLQ